MFFASSFQSPRRLNQTYCLACKCSVHLKIWLLASTPSDALVTATWFRVWKDRALHTFLLSMVISWNLISSLVFRNVALFPLAEACIDNETLECLRAEEFLVLWPFFLVPCKFSCDMGLQWHSYSLMFSMEISWQCFYTWTLNTLWHWLVDTDL